MLNLEAIFQYAKPLSFATDTPIHECARLMETIHRPRTSWFEGSTELELRQISSRQYDVQIEVKRRRGLLYEHPTVSVKGSLSLNREGKASFEGQVKFGLYYFLGCILLTVVMGLAVLGLLNGQTKPSNIPGLVVVGAATAYFWWVLINDRQNIIHKVRFSML